MFTQLNSVLEIILAYFECLVLIEHSSQKEKVATFD